MFHLTRIQFLSLALLFHSWGCQSNRQPAKDLFRPSDHLFWQRSYPGKSFDISAWNRELLQISKEVSYQNQQRETGNWVLEGPGNAGARINTVAVHPENHQVILVGYSAGGIYKTKNGGQSWYPVFDEFSILAIGDIVFDPLNPSRVYAGTGDVNISGIPFTGNGIYVSEDEGESWNWLGLDDVGVISEILIAPNSIYVASMGTPFFRDENRGLYRSTDLGQNWAQIFFASDSTGVIDVAMDPDNEGILYVATWDRIRNYEESTSFGQGARIYRTEDAGLNWSELGGGLPNKEHSRIGLEISLSNPDRLYAVYVDTDHHLEDIYTSGDAGKTWSTLPTKSGSNLGTNVFGGFGWYFGKIRVSPWDENELYLLGVVLWRWDSRRRQWSRVDQSTGDAVHVDKHDLVFMSPDTLLLATDGGLYRSDNRAASWKDIENIPTTQFYRVAYNPHQPDMFYGGAQDNGSLLGNESMVNQWITYFGGDGFRTIFHPENPMIYYVETQQGSLYVTSDGGKNHEDATRGINNQDPVNWDAPVIMSQFDPNVLYFGTDRVYRSITGVQENFTPISNKLTDPVVLLDATSNITALAESPYDKNILFAGTGDGNVWRSLDFGKTWQVSTGSLPDRYVTSIHFSPDIPGRIYISHSGYKAGENLSHVFRSDNHGISWTSIDGNLPSLPVNDLLVLPNNQDQVLFAATDGGVYFSRNAGMTWSRLGNNMPVIPVFDLEYNPTINSIISGTFGKSIQSFDLTQVNIRGDVETGVRNPVLISLTLTPNPVVDRINLDWLFRGIPEWTIYNTQGQRVKSGHLQSPTIEVTGMVPGVYQLLLTDSGLFYHAAFLKL